MPLWLAIVYILLSLDLFKLMVELNLVDYLCSFGPSNVQVISVSLRG